MTERRKARVGDTIRLNGKHPYRKVGEHVVTRVVEERFDFNGMTSTYWVQWEDDPDDPYASAWESQFDIVEPEPQFNKGDRVKLTPKDGGETMIYGEVQYSSTTSHHITITGDGQNTFQKSDWNIELVKPSTEEILNGLGENAFVAHRTVSGWSPYVKIEGKWRLLDEGYNDPDYVDNVAHYIDHEGFEIIFEGVKDE